MIVSTKDLSLINKYHLFCLLKCFNKPKLDVLLLRSSHEFIDIFSGKGFHKKVQLFCRNIWNNIFTTYKKKYLQDFSSKFILSQIQSSNYVAPSLQFQSSIT